MFNLTIDHGVLFGVVNVLLNTYAAILLTIVFLKQRVVKRELEVHDKKKKRWVRGGGQAEKLTMVGSVELEEKDDNEHKLNR